MKSSDPSLLTREGNMQAEIVRDVLLFLFYISILIFVYKMEKIVNDRD